jgi:hypothetical protein
VKDVAKQGIAILPCLFFRHVLCLPLQMSVKPNEGAPRFLLCIFLQNWQAVDLGWQCLTKYISWYCNCKTFLSMDVYLFRTMGLELVPQTYTLANNDGKISESDQPCSLTVQTNQKTAGEHCVTEVQTFDQR